MPKRKTKARKSIRKKTRKKSSSEEGCLTFDLHGSVDQPGSYLLHEVWASREAHSEHTHTPHFLRWDARKDALLTSRDGTFWKQIA